MYFGKNMFIEGIFIDFYREESYQDSLCPMTLFPLIKELLCGLEGNKILNFRKAENDDHTDFCGFSGGRLCLELMAIYLLPV